MSPIIIILVSWVAVGLFSLKFSIDYFDMASNLDSIDRTLYVIFAMLFGYVMFIVCVVLFIASIFGKYYYKFFNLEKFFFDTKIFFKNKKG